MRRVVVVGSVKACSKTESRDEAEWRHHGDFARKQSIDDDDMMI